MTREPASSRIPRRRGSTYVLVLAVAMIVVVIGLGGLAARRVQTRLDVLEQDANASGLLAGAAVEHALHAINTDVWWREAFADREAVFGPEITFGRGHIAWRLDDLRDDDLADEDGDPIRIYGRGRVGDARRAYSVAAFPAGEPLDALRTALHAEMDMDVSGVLDVRLGPVSSNAQVDVTGGQILGSVEAAAIAGPENVVGSVTVPAPAEMMPSPAIFEVYDSIASSISYGVTGGSIEDLVLSPASNPLNPGKRNPDGVYAISVPGGATLRIRRCRIEGTLVVKLSGDSSRLEIDPDVVWRPARADFPALVVYTTKSVGTTVAIDCSGELDEFASGVNFNPSHTPYYGSSDTDTSDVYPASLRGLFHVIRNEPFRTAVTTITAENRIIGCLIVDGRVDVNGAKLSADPALLSVTPLGYTTIPTPGNHLTNGDMEDGLTAWSAVGASVLESTGAPHSGLKRIDVKDRNSASNGIKQDVTGKILSGTTYEVTAWLMMRDDPEDVRLSLKINSDVEGVQWFDITDTVQKTWTRVTGELTPTWTGTLQSAHWVARTTTSAQDFMIDDVALAPLSTGPPPARMVAVPGTWRAESAADP